jgi:hypothetical protein
MDIEWALDGQTNKLFIVQVRLVPPAWGDDGVRDGNPSLNRGCVGSS